MACIADLFDGGLTTLLVASTADRVGSHRTVGTLSEDTARTLDGMGIMTVQASGLPDLHVFWKLTQVCSRISVAFIANLTVRMRRSNPPGLVMAGHADNVVVRVELTINRFGILLETVYAQELDIFTRHIGADMRVMTSDALHLIVLQRQKMALRISKRARRLLLVALLNLIDLSRMIELAITLRLRVVEGERDRVVVTQIDTEPSGKPGQRS